MRAIRAWLMRLADLLNRQERERELSEELKSHLELHINDNLRSGMTREEARRQALVRLGGIEQTKEAIRSRQALGWIDSLAQDVRFALRTLRKNPGFTIVAVLTLALGIGATTAIFTLMQQVMMGALPVARPAQLWRIGDAAACCYSKGYTQGDGRWLPQNDWSLFSWEEYKLFRANTPAFEELAAFQIGENNAELAVRRAGSPTAVQTANGEYVSGNFFQTFGVSAWAGRVFSDADDREGAPPVAVMSFRAWHGEYGSDPSVVGATYELNGHAFTVIGITPPSFFGAKIAISDMPDFWLPLTTEPLMAGATSRLKNSALAWLDLIGRVRPGTNPKTLEMQLRVELHQWLASHLADMSSQEKTLWQSQTLRLTPGGAGVSLMRQDYQEALWLLLAGSICVLALACANIANLLLARGLRGRHETALRAALGASRLRLVRKALIESLTLSIFGAAAGIGVSYAGATLILRLVFRGSNTGVPVQATPSGYVLLFALGVSVISGVLFGSIPAWTASRAEPIEPLRGSSRTVGSKRRLETVGAQKILAIAQTAVSITLLSAAAMLGQSLRNLEQRNFGFDTSGRYLVSIDPKISNYKQEQLVPLYREIEDRLRTVPGVSAVGAVLESPQNGWVLSHGIDIEGKAEDEGSSGSTRVTPGFFEALGDKILMGRPITDEDNADTRPVAVVNESFAKRFFGKENPIGRHFGVGSQKNAGMYEIVGVASDVEFGNDPEPIYFLPEAQSTHFDDPEIEEREVWSHYLYDLVIWARGNLGDLEMRVRRAVADADPNLIMYDVRPYSSVIAANSSQQSMIATLTSVFALVGVVLAAVGLYGVTAYGVERRTSEIGIRMALGAHRRSVMGMVLREAFEQVGFGLVLGIPAAVCAGYLIASQLFGVKPWDPLALLKATLLLAAVTLIAALIPAWRAIRVDPMEALRHE